MRILFECHHSYYLPNFTPVIREFQRRGLTDISLSIPSNRQSGEINGIRSTAEKMGVAYLSADNEDQRIAALHDQAFEVIIVGNVGKLEAISLPTALTVMIYHGIGLKQTYYRDISARIDLRAVESKERYDQLQTAGAENLVLTGFTKLDPLAETYASHDDDIEKLGLDPQRQTILYAPTFYPTSQDALLPALIRETQEYNLIIKLHNFSWTQKRYRHQSRLATDLLTTRPNYVLADVDDFDIIPYYQISDLLISDISSTLFEFLPADRPIIMTEFFNLRLKHRIFKRRFRRKLDFSRWQGIDFTRRTGSVTETKNAIGECLANPARLSPLRQAAIGRYLYRADGQASERLVDAVISKFEERHR